MTSRRMCTRQKVDRARPSINTEIASMFKDSFEERNDIDECTAVIRIFRRVLLAAWDGKPVEKRQIEKTMRQYALSTGSIGPVKSACGSIPVIVSRGRRDVLRNMLDETEAQLDVGRRYIDWVAAYNRRRYDRLPASSQRRVRSTLMRMFRSPDTSSAVPALASKMEKMIN